VIGAYHTGRGPRAGTQFWLAPSLSVGQHRFCVGEKAWAVDRFGVIGLCATLDGIEAGSLRLAAGP